MVLPVILVDQRGPALESILEAGWLASRNRHVLQRNVPGAAHEVQVTASPVIAPRRSYSRQMQRTQHRLQQILMGEHEIMQDLQQLDSWARV